MFHATINCVPNTVLLSDRKALAQGEAETGRPRSGGQPWRVCPMEASVSSGKGKDLLPAGDGAELEGELISGDSVLLASGPSIHSTD